MRRLRPVEVLKEVAVITAVRHGKEREGEIFEPVVWPPRRRSAPEPRPEPRRSPEKTPRRKRVRTPA